ncbi:hypothetical protein FSZ31_04425 [Sphingorhabdus soli]|uniref:Uncharacterized protein n=1 Tax=Flavisphingopyxis soli TaxID=2601267 RepID=A0A5C6ULK0_9SPHN|nr:hypothetical protein [Sphingorhabdus soli]TXC73973.1 hypothetical protein FSZ31_04425 [Sphingorhabdus soli]
MTHTIQCPETGEIQVVGNLDGYEGWTVICSGKTMPSEDHVLDPVKKKWTKCPKRRAARERRVAARDHDAMLARIEELEAKVENLMAATDATPRP